MNNSTHQIFLQARYEIDAPDFWWAIECDQLKIESPESFRLEMRVLNDLDTDEGPRFITRYRTEIIVTQRTRLSPKSHAIITRLEDSPSMDEVGTFELLDTPMSNFKHLFSYSWVSKEFWTEMQKLHTELDRSTFRILNNLFWRLGVHCGPSKMWSEFFELIYSTDGEHFEPLPVRMDIKGELVPHNDKTLEKLKLRKAVDFIVQDVEAPIHHVLFREAWKCRESENRVSVVMATAAAESAVKNLISALMPDTIWLLENTQSPPLVKIVTEFFPKLPVKYAFNGIALSPSETIVEMLKRIITCRNKIVHGSPPPMPTEKELEKWLLAVRDLLWLTDYYNGHEWALEHISSSSVEELKKRGVKS